MLQRLRDELTPSISAKIPQTIFIPTDPRWRSKGVFRENVTMEMGTDGVPHRVRSAMDFPKENTLLIPPTRLGSGSYLHKMHNSTFCLVVCGDTMTSRRLFDCIAANGIPVVQGWKERYFGEPNIVGKGLVPNPWGSCDERLKIGFRGVF